MIADKLTTFYDGLVVISTNLEQYYKRYNNNLLRVPILSNTEDVPLQLPSSYNASENFRLGFTGSITLKKEGFDCFYKALALVKAKHINFELHLYGPIFEKDLLLDELPRQLGIKENVFYHGIINQDHLINEIQKNHLLVLPRPLNFQTQYGFSTKLSEYLVSGIPVLVTDVSDNALYIQDGYNGFIIPPGNSEIMAEKILYIVSNYESIREAIAKNAYLTAKKYFNYKTHSNALCNFLFENKN
jgi:glycosyltransferase involved in cell wall biosynthesis